MALLGNIIVLRKLRKNQANALRNLSRRTSTCASELHILSPKSFFLLQSPFNSITIDTDYLDQWTLGKGDYLLNCNARAF